jgi:uncharacterized protein
MTRTLFLVPGWQNSGPGHWQSLWEAKLKGAKRAEMPNWEFPRREEWVEALRFIVAEDFRLNGEAPILIGHSIGCLAIAHLAKLAELPIHGAFLAAPSDLERKDCPEVLRDFAPTPRLRFPFPSIVVASKDDPFTAPERAQDMAMSWGSRFHLIENAGHINTASGFGEWPRGEALLQELIR